MYLFERSLLKPRQRTLCRKVLLGIGSYVRKSRGVRAPTTRIVGLLEGGGCAHEASIARTCNNRTGSIVLKPRGRASGTYVVQKTGLINSMGGGLTQSSTRPAWSRGPALGPRPRRVHHRVRLWVSTGKMGAMLRFPIMVSET